MKTKTVVSLDYGTLRTCSGWRGEKEFEEQVLDITKQRLGIIMK